MKKQNIAINKNWSHFKSRANPNNVMKSLIRLEKYKYKINTNCEKSKNIPMEN